MVTVRGSYWPSRTALIHAKRSVEPIRPRLSVTSSSLERVRDLADGVELLVAVAVFGVVHLHAEPADVREAADDGAWDRHPAASPSATMKLNAPYGIVA